jgi:hypothetical protein
MVEELGLGNKHREQQLFNCSSRQRIVLFVTQPQPQLQTRQTRGHRQHLNAVKNHKLCGTALAKNDELCDEVRWNLSNCAVYYI